MFFGFTSHFKQLINDLNKNDLKALVIRMDRVPYIDQSGLYAMEEAIFELYNKGVLVIITGLKSQPYDMLKSIDIIPGLIPENQVFEKLEIGFKWLNDMLDIDKKY